jgi:hypothetical protein
VGADGPAAGARGLAGGAGAANVSYFAAPSPSTAIRPSPTRISPPAARSAPRRALHQLEREIGALWPEAGAPGAFPWQWLVDAKEGGRRRFRQPVLARQRRPVRALRHVGGEQHAVPAGHRPVGLSNLFLTGDWIRTGINAGCVEAAVMAGMQTSRAMTGYP